MHTSTEKYTQWSPKIHQSSTQSLFCESCIFGNNGGLMRTKRDRVAPWNTHTHTQLYLTLTFISSQTQGNKWSRSKLTSQRVFLWKRSPINLKPCTRFTCIFHYFSFRLVKLPWTNPLCPFLWGSPSFSKRWVMFGQSVCWSCTLRPHSALLKARGLPGWAAESDRWPGPRAPKYSGTTPVLLLRQCTESGRSVLDCDAPQHSLVVFALRPE